MNIMLVTVTERTREIGVRKTVGARRLDIFLQFLWEAILLSVTGGTIGVLGAALVCALVSRHTPLRPIVTAQAVAMAFGVCFAVGIVFGVAPAVRAARMNPVDALRWE
jgi:ABC-type antimicrobial peptide transport system, permease component